MPFSCDIVSADPISADLGKPAGEGVSKTLRYGPPNRSTECRVIAVIRLGSADRSAQSIKGDQPNLPGVFLPDDRQPLAVVIADDGAVHEGPVVLRYVVPKTVARTRHLLTGLAGSSRYSVQAELAETGVEVTVSTGGDITASPQGTLLFDLSPDGEAGPVRVKAMPAAQEVAATLVK